MRKNNYLSAGVFRFLFLWSAILPVACTGSDKELPFPEGKYPVEFTSQVYGMKVNTRTTTNNTWEGGEKVSVIFGDEYYAKNYIAAPDGSMTCDDPFYWTSNSATVIAWYQFGKNETSLPIYFRSEANQSTIENYNKSDFIMACQTISFSDTEKKLKFKHLAAKVIVNLKGDDTTGDASNAVLTFIGVTYQGTFKAQPSDNRIDVNQTRLGEYSFSITPYTCPTPASGFQKSVQALLSPHYADGVSAFIEIKLNDKTYHYTPPPADCDLQSGKQYTYNITVRDNGTTLSPADVQLTQSDEWTDAGSEDISSTPQ